jgi:hypothetical protein
VPVPVPVPGGSPLKNFLSNTYQLFGVGPIPDSDYDDDDDDDDEGKHEGDDGKEGKQDSDEDADPDDLLPDIPINADIEETSFRRITVPQLKHLQEIFNLDGKMDKTSRISVLNKSPQSKRHLAHLNTMVKDDQILYLKRLAAQKGVVLSPLKKKRGRPPLVKT